MQPTAAVCAGHEPAHFHAEHQGRQAKVDFDGNVVAGMRTLLHRPELEANWASMKAGRSLDKIPPLE